jgi:hypothetical protein
MLKLPPSAHPLRESHKSVRAVHIITLNDSTDKLELLRVGKRGGWRKLWTFGPVPKSARLA